MYMVSMCCLHPEVGIVCTWAKDERPANFHMSQPNAPVGVVCCDALWVLVTTGGGLAKAVATPKVDVPH
jgi:hypothetical protein